TDALLPVGCGARDNQRLAPGNSLKPFAPLHVLLWAWLDPSSRASSAASVESLSRRYLPRQREQLPGLSVASQCLPPVQRPQLRQVKSTHRSSSGEHRLRG